MLVLFGALRRHCGGRSATADGRKRNQPNVSKLKRRGAQFRPTAKTPIEGRLRPARCRAGRFSMSHNTFGHLFRVTTWGESHGPALGCVVDGCPPGIRFTRGRDPGLSSTSASRASRASSRSAASRTTGQGALRRLLDEDGVTMITTGTPISMLIENVDQRSKDYGEIARQLPARAMPTSPMTSNTASATIAAAAAPRPARRRRASRPARIARLGRARRDRARRAGARSASTRSTAPTGTGRRSTKTRSSRPTPISCRSGRSISTASARPAPRSAR